MASGCSNEIRQPTTLRSPYNSTCGFASLSIHASSSIVPNLMLTYPLNPSPVLYSVVPHLAQKWFVILSFGPSSGFVPERIVREVHPLPKLEICLAREVHPPPKPEVGHTVEEEVVPVVNKAEMDASEITGVERVRVEPAEPVEAEVGQEGHAKPPDIGALMLFVITMPFLGVASYVGSVSAIGYAVRVAVEGKKGGLLFPPKRLDSIGTAGSVET